jgi:hypothetical protein
MHIWTGFFHVVLCHIFPDPFHFKRTMPNFGISNDRLRRFVDTFNLDFFCEIRQYGIIQNIIPRATRCATSARIRTSATAGSATRISPIRTLAIDTVRERKSARCELLAITLQVRRRQ